MADPPGFMELVSAYDRTKVRRVEATYRYLDGGSVREETRYEVDILPGPAITLIPVPSRRMEIQVGMECRVRSAQRAPLVTSGELVKVVTDHLKSRGLDGGDVAALAAIFRGGWDCDDHREEIAATGRAAGQALANAKERLPRPEWRFLRRLISSFSKGSYVPFVRLADSVKSEKSLPIEYHRIRKTGRGTLLMATIGLLRFNSPIQIVPHGSFHWTLDAPDELVFIGAKAPKNWTPGTYRATKGAHDMHVYMSAAGKKQVMSQRNTMGIERNGPEYNWLIFWTVPLPIRMLLLGSAWYFAFLGQRLLAPENAATPPIVAAGFLAAALLAMVANGTSRGPLRPFVVTTALLVLAPILIGILVATSTASTQLVGSLIARFVVVCAGFLVASAVTLRDFFAIGVAWKLTR